MTLFTATVAVLTYNGEEYLDALLTAVEEQEVQGEIEILVIDSGSTDGTLPIIARHPRAILHQIPNIEFGHGRTRDLAVRMSRGDHVAFLTQDAVPAGPHWLAELLAPFAMTDRIAVVTGRQHPRARAFPLQKYDIISTFDHQGPRGGTSFFGNELEPLTPKQAGVAWFNSDVNAAVRRDLATTVLPFRDVPYSEDQLMAQDAAAQGFWRAYASRAVVEHSNDLSFREYGPRIFDETVGLRRLGFPFHRFGIAEVFVAIVKGSIGDSMRIVRDEDYSVGQRIRWLFVNPWYQWRRWTAMFKASRVDLADLDAIKAGSLEHRRKKRHAAATPEV
jgi:rhamnosyltransferase